MSTVSTEPTQERPSPLREIVQPFIDLVHAPRALWGINVGYFLEGLVYFGILQYLALYFSESVFKGLPAGEQSAHNMVGILTFGITIDCGTSIALSSAPGAAWSGQAKPASKRASPPTRS